MASEVINNIDSDDWILVDSKKRKKRKYLPRKKIVLNQSEYDKLDLLSKTVYDILQEHAYLIPASYITKQVNCRLESTTYTKKDIGQILYKGPLYPYLFRYAKKHPTLWGLRYLC